MIDLEKENKRLSLSIKALQENKEKSNNNTNRGSNSSRENNLKYKPTETSGFSIGDIIGSKQGEQLADNNNQ